MSPGPRIYASRRVSPHPPPPRAHPAAGGNAPKSIPNSFHSLPRQHHSTPCSTPLCAHYRALPDPNYRSSAPLKSRPPPFRSATNPHSQTLAVSDDETLIQSHRPENLRKPSVQFFNSFLLSFPGRSLGSALTALFLFRVSPTTCSSSLHHLACSLPLFSEGQDPNISRRNHPLVSPTSVRAAAATKKLEIWSAPLPLCFHAHLSPTYAGKFRLPPPSYSYQQSVIVEELRPSQLGIPFFFLGIMITPSRSFPFLLLSSFVVFDLRERWRFGFRRELAGNAVAASLFEN